MVKVCFQSLSVFLAGKKTFEGIFSRVKAKIQEYDKLSLHWASSFLLMYASAGRVKLPKRLIRLRGARGRLRDLQANVGLTAVVVKSNSLITIQVRQSRLSRPRPQLPQASQFSPTTSGPNKMQVRDQYCFTIHFLIVSSSN